MTISDLGLRVSVATLDRVVFQHPHDGTLMLALEHKATLLTHGEMNSIYVRAQPFGGAVRLLNPDALRNLIGDFAFDSERSRTEQDFRILIQPSAWATLKGFCQEHLRRIHDPVLETDPSRELTEEFAECLQATLVPTQFVYRPVGLVIEDEPTPTDNIHSLGVPTVRLYSIFEVTITDSAICESLLNTSNRYSDVALGELAMKNAQTTGRGRANSVLTLPLKHVEAFYHALPVERRYGSNVMDGHQLDRNVPAILDALDIPQFQWLT